MNLSQIFFQEDLPSHLELRKVIGEKRLLVLYDQELLRYPQVANWLSEFEFGFSLVAGEDLKDLQNFASVVERILPATDGYGPSHTAVLSVGGGSVGDFAGFFSSVLKRGVDHYMLPSTWLAALDSAHGGKTALNVGVSKNQIGTYWPAASIWVVRSLLESQPEELRQSAFGELAKMAFLSGGQLFAQLATLQSDGGSLSEDLLWRLLPLAVKHKYEVVDQDPHEKKGIRQILNLGHTFGHALELHHDLPHGRAVLLGLQFAVEWSAHLGLLKTKDAEVMKAILSLEESDEDRLTLNSGRLREALLRDKKIQSAGKLKFILLEGPGIPLVRHVSVDEVLVEAQRQGWCH